MTETDVQKILEQAEDFPALPKVAEELVRLTAKLSVSVPEVSQLLQSDPPLRERIQAVIGAPFYRFTGRTFQLDQVISILGYKKVCSLAVGLSLLQQFPPGHDGEFSYRTFWERSLCSAIAACKIAAHLGGDLSEEAFTVGLIQDIGNLLLIRYRPFAYGQAVGLAKGKGEHTVHAEQEALGIDHTAVGALLCKHWGLSPFLVDIVRHHHFSEFDRPPPSSLKNTLQVANLANLMTDVSYEPDSGERKEILYERAETFFSFEPGSVDEILEEIPGHLQKIGAALALPIGEETEVENQDALSYPNKCPQCGASGAGKFCAECGASMETEFKPPPLNTGKILIVEDSSATRLALVVIARRMGYQTLEGLNGGEAVKIARREHPGVILMDINMPGMTGIEALKRLRQQKSTAHIPVVMLTSVTDNDIVIEALQSGANDYIVKPFTATLIQDRLQQYILEAEE